MSTTSQGYSPGRRAAAAGLAALALTLPFGAGSATAAPVYHYTFPASEMGSLDCGAHTYTFVSGTFSVVTKSADTGDIRAAHLRLTNVTAQDEAMATYRVVGTETYNDAKALLVSKLTIFDLQGRRVDNLNVVAKNYESGGHGMSIGTCWFGAE